MRARQLCRWARDLTCASWTARARFSALCKASDAIRGRLARSKSARSASRRARSVGRGVESAGGFHDGDEVLAEMLEVVVAVFEGVDFIGIDVEAYDGETRAVEGGEEWQADVAEAHDTDLCGGAGDFLEEVHEGIM